jgi:hypothetical protein
MDHHVLYMLFLLKSMFKRVKSIAITQHPQPQLRVEPKYM